MLLTLQTLCEQVYPGEIELIPVVDGASQNHETLRVIRELRLIAAFTPIVCYAQSLNGSAVAVCLPSNAGLAQASGEIVLALDGDTSFDNNTISALVRHFADPNVPAVSGSLRVRNATTSWVSTYFKNLSIFCRYTPAKQACLNGIRSIIFLALLVLFVKTFLQHIGGWDTHTAEDLDITLRIKSYFGRQPYRIPF